MATRRTPSRRARGNQAADETPADRNEDTEEPTPEQRLDEREELERLRQELLELFH